MERCCDEESLPTECRRRRVDGRRPGSRAVGEICTRRCGDVRLLWGDRSVAEGDATSPGGGTTRLGLIDACPCMVESTRSMPSKSTGPDGSRLPPSSSFDGVTRIVLPAPARSSSRRRRSLARLSVSRSCVVSRSAAAKPSSYLAPRRWFALSTASSFSSSVCATARAPSSASISLVNDRRKATKRGNSGSSTDHLWRFAHTPRFTSFFSSRTKRTMKTIKTATLRAKSTPVRTYPPMLSIGTYVYSSDPFRVMSTTLSDAVSSRLTCRRVYGRKMRCKARKKANVQMATSVCSALFSAMKTTITVIANLRSSVTGSQNQMASRYPCNKNCRSFFALAFSSSCDDASASACPLPSSFFLP
mmetsp:Transcript_6351/g.19985  ORF Transcript_6351/g.19985 Transcript_6351/m.19985 type:complete len:360 (+) Transcript_6351:719-1798(+)